MQMWFSQYHTVNVKLDVRIQEQLFSGQSDYQKIDVFKSYEFGKMVALDGEIVFSDTDEFIYDEMVTHVPMAVHPNAKKILIIGGGDGGVDAGPRQVRVRRGTRARGTELQPQHVHLRGAAHPAGDLHPGHRHHRGPADVGHPGAGVDRVHADRRVQGLRRPDVPLSADDPPVQVTHHALTLLR